MFSYLTNDEKLLCLKYWGNIVLQNALSFLIEKPMPSYFYHFIMESVSGFWTISYSFTKKFGTLVTLSFDGYMTSLLRIDSNLYNWLLEEEFMTSLGGKFYLAGSSTGMSESLGSKFILKSIFIFNVIIQLNTLILRLILW